MRYFKNEMVSYEELLKAYQDCRKRKRRTINAMEFEMAELSKLYQLWIDLNTNTYKIGKSICFCIDYPVKREIFAANFRDRIVHHLVINRTMKYFEEEFINDSYSCRVGKGTWYGVQQCRQQIIEASQNYTVLTYIVKCDLKSFFMSINKNILCKKLEEFMHKYYKGDSKDLEFTLKLMKQIANHQPQRNCIRKQEISAWKDLPPDKSLFSCLPNFGLPIGNLTSQIFANFFLSEFDHYMLEDLGIKYYGRYVDDFFFLIHNVKEAKSILNKCRIKLSSMGVMLHPKKMYIQEVKKGVKFIGTVIKPNRIYISNRTKGSFWRTLEEYSKIIEAIHNKHQQPSPKQIEQFVCSVNSYLGFLVHHNTFNIRKKLLTSKAIIPWYRYCYVNLKFTKLIIYKEFTFYKNAKKN